MAHVDPAAKLAALSAQVHQGGAAKYHQKNTQEGKLFCRERLRLLFDPDSEFIEDGLLANNSAADLPAVQTRANPELTVAATRAREQAGDAGEAQQPEERATRTCYDGRRLPLRRRSP